MMKRHLLPESFTADDELQVLGTPRGEALGPVIRCLLWNILKAKRSNWLVDFSELSADRDLVLLQEAVLKAPTDDIFTKSKRFEWIMARSFRHPITRVEHGIKTGAIAKSLEQHFYLSPHSEPLSQTQKLLMTTSYAIAGTSDTLLVLNMHAINFVSIQKYADQLEQLQCALEAHSGPVILGGDFNTWNLSRLEHFLVVARNAGLQEASMDRRKRLMHLNQHLDHLFYRGLKLRLVESLSYYQSSDHAPITATFEILPR